MSDVIELSAKAKAFAKEQAEKEGRQMRSRWSKNEFRTWEGLEQSIGIKVPPSYRAKEFTYMNLSSFITFWTYSWEARITADREIAAEQKVKIVTGGLKEKDCTTFGNWTLFPEQEALFRRLVEDLYVKREKTAVLQDGETGSGKSFIAVAFIAELIKRGVLNDPVNRFRAILPYQFIIFTPKNVVEQYKRVIERAGLKAYLLNGKILVTSYSQFQTDFGKAFVTEKVDEFETDFTYLEWQPMQNPVCIIWDECQKLNNWKTYQTRAARAAIHGSQDTMHIFMSATPWEKVNDSRTFLEAVCVKGDTVNNVRVDSEESFKAFASLVDPEAPHKPNKAACKRLRRDLGRYIYSLPYAKWKHLPKNQTVIIDFRNENDRQIYESAHARYIEVCRKVGKNTKFGQFEKFVALANFRKTVEPLRAEFLAERALQNYREGKVATAIGVCFKETIIRITDYLARHGVPREHIAIIWGGGKNVKVEELLTREQIDAMHEKTQRGEMLTKRELKQLKLTLNHNEEMHHYGEDVQQQAARHARMNELRLRGTQSAVQRQKEIDAFQTGRATICLFTLASGGVGLSLDKDKPELLPREGWFTPVWNGKEFAQALGRLVRRASLAAAWQYICYMRGTVEESHVAPNLDNKLQCIGEITGRVSVVDLLENTFDASKVPSSFTTADEIAKITAEDNESIGHVHAVEEDDDDEDADVVEEEDFLTLT